jgi:uncharacterized membrane protein YheB (UPF0754 family)
MRNQALNNFNNTLIEKAVTLIDKDKMAKELAKYIENTMLENFETLVDGLDFEVLILNQLTSTDNPAGKRFNKALQDITKRMANAV